MKARLCTGKTVELVKDCDCLTHDGPHWLHTDALHKASNDAMRLKGNMFGFAGEEHARIIAKRYNMESRGIERIFSDDKSSTES